MAAEEQQIQAARQAVAQQQEQINQANQISQQQLRTASAASPMQALLQRQEAARQSAIAQQTLQNQTQAINQYEKQLADYREAQRIASPQFQKGAFDEAVRVFSSGYGRLGLPSDDSAFSQAVRTYYNQITKGMKPEWQAENINVLQGYKSVPAPQLPELPASSVPSPIVNLTSQGVNFGKYNTNTNVYTSPQGQSFSVPINRLSDFVASQNIEGIKTPLSLPGFQDYLQIQAQQINRDLKAQKIAAPSPKVTIYSLLAPEISKLIGKLQPQQTSQNLFLSGPQPGYGNVTTIKNGPMEITTLPKGWEQRIASETTGKLKDIQAPGAITWKDFAKKGFELSQVPEEKIVTPFFKTFEKAVPGTAWEWIQKQKIYGTPGTIAGAMFGTQEQGGSPIGSTAINLGSWFIPGVGEARAASFFGSEIGKRGIYSLDRPKESWLKSQAEYSMENPLQTIGTAFLGAAALKSALGTAGSLLQNKISAVEPSADLIKQASETSRPRPTILLKDEAGNYILGRTKTGDIISFGGKQEIGESARIAALREFAEEALGMKFPKGHILTSAEQAKILDNFKNFRFSGNKVFPEENFKTFTATLKKSAVINPGSDISNFVKISPKNLFIKDVTGQTPLNPASRFTTTNLIQPGRIRAYEIAIINNIEKGKALTWLKVETPQGPYYLGTQSRYDVPAEIQKQYLGKSDMALAHATQSSQINKFIWWPGEKQFKVTAEKSQRGAARGLHVSPPIGKEPGSPGYIGISYLGIKSPGAEYGGVRFGFPSALLFKEKTISPIVATPKTLSGVESELIIKPETLISSKGTGQIGFLGGKIVLFQPAQLTKSMSAGEILKSAEAKPEVLRDITSAKPREIFYRYTTGEEIAKPSAALASLNLKSITPSSLSKASRDFNLVMSSQPYASKSEISPVPSTQLVPTTSKSFELPSSPRFVPSSQLPEPSSRLPAPSEIIIHFKSNLIPLKSTPTPSEQQVTPEMISPPYKTTPKSPFIYPSGTSRQKKTAERSQKRKPGFNVLVKRYGKYTKYPISASYQGARQFLKTKLVSSLAASGKIIPSGKPEIKRVYGQPIPEAFFRGPIRRRIQQSSKFEIVQKQSRVIPGGKGRLTTMAERAEIKSARQASRRFNPLAVKASNSKRKKIKSPRIW